MAKNPTKKKMMLKKKRGRKYFKKQRYTSIVRTALADIVQTVGAASGANYYFALGLSPAFAEIQALYNYVRLRYIELIWQPSFNVTTQSAGATTNISPPMIYCVYDPTPTTSTSPMLIIDMQQFSNLKVLDARKRHRILVFPKSSNTVFNISSATPTYDLQPCHKQWLSTIDLSGANTSPASLTEFRGFRFRIENLGTAKDNQVIGTWRIKYHIDAKEPK